MTRSIRTIVLVALALAALPSVAVAADAIKDVFVTNTAQNPVPVRGIGPQQVTGSLEVSNLPAAQQLVSSRGGIYKKLAGELSMTISPNVILTDLVITRSPASSDPICQVEVVRMDSPETATSVFYTLFPSETDSTEQLHLESGLLVSPEGWRVRTVSSCTLHAFWSGYRVP